jgi:HSP20 family molecular chaperone IbpA
VTTALANRFSSNNGLLDSFMKPNRNDLFYPFQQFFDSFYDDLYSGLSPSGLKSKSGFPRWDIYQTDTDWVVEMSTTGCEPENVNVEILPVKDNSGYSRLLKVSGRVSEDNQLGDSVRYSVRELRRSAFERCVYLPNNIEGDPEATMKNGILRLSWKLPKSQLEEVKRIEIKKLDD